MFCFRKASSAVCTLLCLFLTAQAQPQKQVADKIVAVIGDHIILRSDIASSVDDLKREGRELSPSVECQLIEQAVISKLLMLQAQKDSLQVTDEEIESEVEQRLRPFMNDLRARKQPAEIDRIKKDLHERLREWRMAEAMQAKILGNTRISPAEVKSFFEKIPADSLPFIDPEYEIGQVIIYPKASADMEKYIVEEMNNYKKQIASNKITFSQLVNSISEDVESKENSGICEWDRNDKTLDPVLLATAVRLKKDEVSAPVKSRQGYHLLQLIERNGDIIIVKQIVRVPAVTKWELEAAEYKLNAIRSRVVAGIIDFDGAAAEANEAGQSNYSIYLIGADGQPYITMAQLDKEMATIVQGMNVGEISKPLHFTNAQGKQGVRLIYVKSRSNAHRINLKDDYRKLSQMALEAKRASVLEKWIKARLPELHIMVEKDVVAECPGMRRFASE